jgi:hypothetical protein
MAEEGEGKGSKSATCPKKKMHSSGLLLQEGKFPTSQKLELQYHDDIIRTKAVATKEGVWKGVLRPGELLKANYRWLKGIPITINHPEDGVSDSALAVGQVVDVEWDEEQQRAIADCELWASKCPPDLIAKIAAGDAVDVSTGYYAAQDPVPGTWGDQPYSEVEKSLFFDHLAIVPLGACTSLDGCGMGAHTGLEDGIKSHEGDEKDINPDKGLNGSNTDGEHTMPEDLRLETLEDLTKFSEDFAKLDEKESKAKGASALTLLATQAKGKTGLFTPPKVEPPAKVTYPMPKLIKAQDSESLTLSFEPTEDPEAVKGAISVLYGEAMKTLAEKEALIKTLTDDKTKLQADKDAIEGGVRKEQIALIQAHSGLTDEETKVYEGLPIPQLKAVALHMEKALQVHAKDPKSKFALPGEGGKKKTVDELNAEFDRALGLPPKK